MGRLFKIQGSRERSQITVHVTRGLNKKLRICDSRILAFSSSYLVFVAWKVARAANVGKVVVNCAQRFKLSRLTSDVARSLDVVELQLRIEVASKNGGNTLLQPSLEAGRPYEEPRIDIRQD